MYFWYTVAVFLVVVELFFLALAIDTVLLVTPRIKKYFRKNSKNIWPAIVIVLIAIAIQGFKDQDFYQYVNNEQTGGLLHKTLKYSLNMLLGFIEIVLGYLFYRKIGEKIRELRSGK